MSARSEVLAAVRRALQGAAVPPAVPREYRRGPAAMLDAAALLDQFVERVSDYRATVVRCSVVEVTSTLASILGDVGRVAVPADLPWPVPRAVVDHDLTAVDLDAIPCAVTGAAVGIALTGTVVLDHGPGQGRRLLSLVPDRHVCVVRDDQVVAGVADALTRLDPARPQTWISGPSATSDIELSRVEGVHGPRDLTVVLVHTR